MSFDNGDVVSAEKWNTSTYSSNFVPDWTFSYKGQHLLQHPSLFKATINMLLVASISHPIKRFSCNVQILNVRFVVLCATVSQVCFSASENCVRITWSESWILRIVY